MGTIIKPVDENNIAEVQKIAHKAWPATYNSFLDPTFVQFELTREYSNHSLLNALKTQERFFLMLNDESHQSLGFFALSSPKSNCVKLNKFYLYPEFKNQGLGKEMLKWVEHYARKQFHANKIELMVNRQNPAKTFYERNGFRMIAEIDTPTNPENPNFVRNDYLMEKILE